jgi:hypothetical protein
VWEAVYFLLLVLILVQKILLAFSITTLQTAYFLDEKMDCKDLISTAVSLLPDSKNSFDASFADAIYKRASLCIENSKNFFIYQMPASFSYSAPLLILSLGFWISDPFANPVKMPVAVTFTAYEISIPSGDSKNNSSDKTAEKNPTNSIPVEVKKDEILNTSRKLLERLESEIQKAKIRQEILNNPQLKALSQALQKNSSSSSSRDLEKILMDKNIQKEWSEKILPLISNKSLNPLSPSKQKKFLENLWKEKPISSALLDIWKNNVKHHISAHISGGSASSSSPSHTKSYLEKEHSSFTASHFFKEIEERKIAPAHWPAVQQYFEILKNSQ